MLNSLILPPETIDSIQEKIEILEKCLNGTNVEDEKIAAIIDLANSRHISLNQLKEEFQQFQSYLYKCIKLNEVLKEKVEQNDDFLLFYVRYDFSVKEVVDKYWDFFNFDNSRETIKNLLIKSVNLYNEVKSMNAITSYQKDKKYIILETLKHLIKSLFEASLKMLDIHVLSEEEINALDLGEFTPKESEAMLISLASTKKWDWVYRNLA
ncbi:hypothetical protein H6G76_09275 [Nostoc sp. FACHB-152]|uniref:hypothetical protein n=1 Tax=unclassified Nostoc TaxID=2593658 RepID=UPI001687DF3E|nr:MULTISPECIES: hypothetical protein [unclassified Nostoc]MBD2447357.1 hypothetical protein [Nostoc sp. FACHB-152]MBD2468042.1 hypothetical protein [Nostoc sp. FACHB-145]